MALAALCLGGCFTVPDYADGTLRCYQDECPPGYHCRTDGFCYRALVTPDASNVPDAGIECAAGIDKRCDDGRPQKCDETGRWVDATACPAELPTCDQGDCVSPCVADRIRCNGVTVREICVDQQWRPFAVCDFVCSEGACEGECVPDTTRCSVDGSSEERCDSSGTWHAVRRCPLVCDPSLRRCGGDCTAGETRCAGSDRQECSGFFWMTVEACPQTCSNGECRPCDPALPEKQCAPGPVLQTCQPGGTWDGGVACPWVCRDKTCTGSCKPNSVVCEQGELKSCGLDGNYDGGMSCAMGCAGDRCADCAAGDHRCNPLGTGTEVCVAGTWKRDLTCPNGCHETATCNACNPTTFAATCQNDATRLTCNPTTFAIDAVACGEPNPACLDGACVPCSPGAQRCHGTDIEHCDAAGTWKVMQTCGSNGCVDPAPPGGTDQTCGLCTTNARRCDGGELQTCADGDWDDTQTCTALGCFDADGEGGPAGYCGTCAAGDKQCSSNNLETCTNGQFQLAQACAATSQTCFDPAPMGGSDAYCGVCVNNAKRCSLGTLQVCVAGAWMNSQTCASPADCLDPDGDTGPGGACSSCAIGHLQCSGSVLQTCQGGAFVNTTDCAATARQCIDPAPQGGTDAYCGVCLNGAKRCLGTGLQVCSGGAWTNAPACDPTLGCFDPDGESGPGGYCRVCTDNNMRCGSGNLETCVIGQWVPRTPACSATAGDTCFDPAPAGGTDAYCGNCLKGADRCSATTPPSWQTCPNGRWTDSLQCSAGFGCYDPSGDGSASPPAYCGECTNGNRQCGGSGQHTLQTCTLGRFVDTQVCTSTGTECFDPGSSGGADAYCGACLVGAHRCTGDNLERCEAAGTGSAWVLDATCDWGCNAGALACCGEPQCSPSQGCGDSPPNACGRSVDCGGCGRDRICCENSFCFGGDDPSDCP